MSNIYLTPAQLADMDLRNFPDEILQAMYSRFLKEIQQRRMIVKSQARVGCQAEASTFRGLKYPNHLFSNHVADYLADLVSQDWTHLFSGDPEPKYYVYAHAHHHGKAVKLECGNVKMRFGGPPFYIGKGIGNRAYDMKRNQGHGATLRELLAKGVRPEQIAHIVCDGLTEPEALALESKLIYLFGTKYEPGRRGLLVNLDIPPRPPLREGRLRIDRQPAGMAAQG